MSEAYLIAGLAFGDEAKGATVDALVRHVDADLVVRYNGGCQAAHHVVLPNGRFHCFSQFGAGMLANNHVRTHLSRYVVVEPLSMVREADHLSKMTDNVWDRTTVSGDAIIVTPFHKKLNRLREKARGDKQHGSCGRGIGVAREFQIKYDNDDRVLRARDIRDENLVRSKLAFLILDMLPEVIMLETLLTGESTPVRRTIQEIDELICAYLSWPAKIVDDFEPSERNVFEGAQGVMLDEVHGTAPYNTWTNTTFENALTLVEEAGISTVTKIGCLRSYYTRHGAGPFPTEDPSLDLPEEHNGGDGFQGKFRVGHFDFTLAKQALHIIGGVDCLAISHVDRLTVLRGAFPETSKRMTEDEFEASIEANLRTPIGIWSWGPSYGDRNLCALDAVRV